MADEATVPFLIMSYPSRFGLWITSLAVTLTSPFVFAAPPSVALVEPQDGATWGATLVLPASANATDVDGAVAKVEFYLDDMLLGTDTTIAPNTLGLFAVGLTPRPQAGTYSLTVRAYSGSGEVAISAARTLNVSPPPPAPTVVTGAAIATSTSAQITGTVNPHNSPIDQQRYWVEFGLSTNYGGTTQ